MQNKNAQIIRFCAKYLYSFHVHSYFVTSEQRYRREPESCLTAHGTSAVKPVTEGLWGCPALTERKRNNKKSMTEDRTEKVKSIVKNIFRSVKAMACDMLNDVTEKYITQT